jgi:hypothetical protein
MGIQCMAHWKSSIHATRINGMESGGFENDVSSVLKICLVERANSRSGICQIGKIFIG